MPISPGCERLKDDEAEDEKHTAGVLVGDGFLLLGTSWRHLRPAL